MSIKKKLVKNSLIQNFLALITALYIYFIRMTSNIKYENMHVPEFYWKNNKPFILAFWHGQLMMLSAAWQIKKDLNILASSHSDGRFGALVAKHFNLNNIPAPSKNNNVSLRPIFNILNQKNYIAITPDGPRGPKEKVSEGIIRIAKFSKVPIIALGFSSSKNFKLKSWDAFLVSKPFSKCSFVWSEPFKIPEDLPDDKILEYQTKLEKEINQCINKAVNNLK